MTLRRLSLLLALSLLGASCSPDKPWLMEKSTLVESPMRLVESREVIRKPLSQMDQTVVADAARLYAKNGAGPLYMVVAYKDNGKIGDAEINARRAAIAGQLAQSGVNPSDIVSSAVPLDTDTPVALIAFDTLEARGPAGCDTPVPGLDVNAEERNMLEYKTGCAVRSYMAKQIARPADLEGVAGLGGRNDGEHLANVVGTQIRPGAPREFLPSYIVSELAGSGGQ